MEKQHDTRKAEAFELLTSYSQEVAPLVKSGKYPNINTAIKEVIYKPMGHTELRKFREWKVTGHKIKKGSKGLPLWARPLSVLKEERRKPDEPAEVHDGPEYFPIVYMFSNQQVERREAA